MIRRERFRSPQLVVTTIEFALVNFFVGDMVWRMNEFTHHVKINKLSPKWEGSYNVVIIVYPNTHVLEGMQGVKLKNTFMMNI